MYEKIILYTDLSKKYKTFVYFLLIVYLFCCLQSQATIPLFLKHLFKQHPKASIECIVISLNEYSSISKQVEFQENEFVLNNKLYDIESIELNQNSVIIHCKFDKAEQDFITLVNELFNDVANDTFKSISIFPFFQLSFFTYQLNRSFKFLTLFHTFIYCVNEMSFFKDSFSPPPEK